MAKIISPVWSSIRGSIAGTTYLTTPSGQIVGRQRTKPTQPDSNNQVFARSALSAAAADWNGMTQVLRTAWNVAAVAFGKTGRHLYIGGRQLIEYISIRNLISPLPVVTNDAPTVGSIPSVNVTQGTPTAPATPTIEVTLQNMQKVETHCLVQISPPFTATRNFWKGPWDTSKDACHKLLASSTGHVDFAGLEAGMFYMIRVIPVYTPNTPDTLKGTIAGVPKFLRCTPTLPA